MKNTVMMLFLFMVLVSSCTPPDDTGSPSRTQPRGALVAESNVTSESQLWGMRPIL